MALSPCHCDTCRYEPPRFPWIQILIVIIFLAFLFNHSPAG